MTSPLRFETETSMVDGEELSPIKISPTKLDYDNKSMLPLKKYPHGLHSRKDGRRITIHNSGISNLLTPKKGEEALKPGKNKILLTSPLVTLQPSLDSLRKSKINLDAKLKRLSSASLGSNISNKENLYLEDDKSMLLVLKAKVEERNLQYKKGNKSPGTPGDQEKALPVQSSPLHSTEKRHHDDSENFSRKVSKVITNANDSDNFSQEEHLIKVDEIFNREDIVSKMEAISSPSNVSRGKVIDDISEGETGDNHGNTGEGFFAENESTLMGKVLKPIGDLNDYITPQRYIEAVAKSPETNQVKRITENFNEQEVTKDYTSPLKNYMPHAKQSDLLSNIYDPCGTENDSSIIGRKEGNLQGSLRSPNSKPVFSYKHVKELQKKHYREIELLQEEIAKKNDQILEFSREATRASNDILLLNQRINELKHSLNKVQENENLLRIQLEHYENELSTATRTVELKETSIQKLKAENSSLSEEYGKMLRELNAKLGGFHELQAKLKELEGDISERRNAEERMNIQLEEARSHINSLSEEASNLKGVNLTLEDEKKQLERSAADIKAEFEQLKHEHKSTKELNLKQQELLEELDKLETLAKDKIMQLEASNEDKVKDKTRLESENQNFCIQIEELKRNNEALSTKIEEYEANITNLKSETERLIDEKASSDEKVYNLESMIAQWKDDKESLENDITLRSKENENLSNLIREYKEQQQLLQSINSEKDEIISGDTKKISELVEKVNVQKQKTADLEKTYAITLEKMKELENDKSNSSLTEEIEDLRKQVAQNHARTNSKIQEVAEQLYFEYSKKHETKVNQVRASFKKQIDTLNFEKKSQARDIESLQKKLDTVNTEKVQLLKLLDEYEALSESKDKKKLSPKKTGFKRPLRF